VHPDQQYADTHPGAHLKSEAWYVFQNDPGARILKGFNRPTSREEFASAIETGKVEAFIKGIPVKAGDCHYLPSGTIHALGAGILAAEVQTPSDTTYRVYDFNRVDPSTGKVRTLHVAQALECIDFSGEEDVQQRSHVAGFHTTVTRLVTCPFFTLEKVRMTEGVQQDMPYDQPVVWMFLEGSAEISVADLKEPIVLKPGETVLFPAAMNKPHIKTTADCVWLEVTFAVK